MKDIRLSKAVLFRKSQVASALVVAFGGLMVAPGVVFAQNADLQRVEVTGSRIMTLNAESPAPVQVMSSADIAASGVANVQELLLKNPVFGTPTISRNNSNFNNESAGVATVDLRNLGTNRTLVLVNGRRFVAGVPGESTVDLNSIPADFIERIEILTGGASSAYGSDAVAGVVNIILKKGFEGLTIDAQGGQSEKGDDTKKKISLTAGANLPDGRGNLMFHFSASQQGAVYSRDRAASAVDQYTMADAVTGDPADLFTATRPFYSSYAPQGRFYYNKDPVTGVAPSRTFDANGNLIRFSTNGPAGDGVGATGFNRSAYRTIAIPTDRMLLALKGDLNLTESHTAFFEGTYANSKTQTQLEPFPLSSANISPGTGGWIPAQTMVNGVPVNNPLIPANLRALLTDTNGDGLTDYSFTRRMSDIGNRGAAADRDTFRVLGGVKGDLNKTWSYEAFASYGFTKEGQTSTGQVNVNNFWNALQVIPDSVTGLPVCADATARAQGCVPANIYGANTLSAAAAAYINAPATLNTKVTQQVYGLTVTGEPFNLPAGPVGIAAGLEYRKETSKTEHDALTISGLNAGNALPDTSGSFSVNEYFVEGRLPLLKNLPMVKSLDSTVAIRQGNYSTVGNTTSWNSGLDWALNSTVRLRATASVSTRAPNINELYQGPSQTFPTGLTDPCEGITATTPGALADRCRAAPGVAANIAANGAFTTAQADKQGVSGYDGGNPNLKAEKGNSKTLGIVITPKSVPLLKNFNFTADYYNISIEDALNLPGRQYLLDQCYQAGDAASCAFITRRNVALGGYSAGSLDLINQGVVNSGGQTAKGIDLTAGYADKVGPGYLSGRITYTHLLKAEQRATSTAPSDSTLGEIGNPTNKWMLNLGYDYGNFAIKSTVTYIGESYLDDQYMISSGYPYEAGRVGSVTYLDLQTTYSFNKKSQLYFGIDNVMNTKAPPIISGLPGNTTGAETDAGTYDPIGRRFYIGLRYSL